jgi:TonB family protein
MNESLFYCSKIILSAGLFILIYRLFVRNSNAFGWNRFYLLSTMILSLFLPFIDISAWFIDEKPIIFYASMLTAQTITVTAQLPRPSLSISDWIEIGYFAIVALFLFRFIWGLSRVLILMMKHDYQQEGKLKIHRLQRKSTFSFFNHIFVQPEHWNKPAIDYILRHEQAHVNHMHSIDSIIAELILVFGWFNPFYYTYRREIHLLHECQADQAVLNSDCDKVIYHQLLLNEVSGNLSYIIVNQFSYSLIKKRFSMISKIKQSRYARLRVLLAIPAAFALMVLFSFTSLEKDKTLLGGNLNLPSIESAQSSIADLLGIQQKPVTKKTTIQFTPPVISKNTTKNKVYSTFTIVNQDPSRKYEESKNLVVVVGYPPREKDEDSVLLVVEQNPDFPGGLNKLLEFLKANIKYPKEAIDKGIQGTVFVQFIVGSDGKIRHAKILRGISNGCDEEALRVVNLMPDWKPGMQNNKRVSTMFQIPVKFQLSAGQYAKAKAKYEKEKSPLFDKNSIVLKPDQNPEFPGGNDALLKFISKNVRYPADAMKNGIIGTVIAQFTVNKKGEIINPEIMHGIGRSCDQEVIRIVNMMPKWTPGKKDGKPVDVINAIPVKFQLQK